MTIYRAFLLKILSQRDAFGKVSYLTCLKNFNYEKRHPITRCPQTHCHDCAR